MIQGPRFKLLLLLVALGFASVFATPSAHALFPVCCSSCNNNYNNCLAGTVYPTCNKNESCCAATVQPCWDTCRETC